MYTTWILIANRSSARIFENRGPGRDLGLVQAVAHPSGHLRDSELVTDKPGRVLSSADETTRHGLDAFESAHEHETELFARHLAAILDRARRNGLFDKLVLVAEPHFLGRLKDALPKQTSERIHTTLSKELHQYSGDELLDRLGDLDGLWSDVHRGERFVPSTRVGER